jgi:hypothetical protein
MTNIDYVLVISTSVNDKSQRAEEKRDEEISNRCESLNGDSEDIKSLPDIERRLRRYQIAARY